MAQEVRIHLWLYIYIVFGQLILEYVLRLVLSQASESILLFNHVRLRRAAVRVSVTHLLLVQIFYKSIILSLTLFSFILVLWHGLLVM